MMIPLLAFLAVVFAQPPPITLVVSHRERAVAAGEVVLVDVSAPTPLRDVNGDWLGHSIIFAPIGRGRWEGLVAIDVGASAGRQTLVIHATTTAGGSLTREYPLTIAKRVFPARRITVAPEFVDPPPEVRPRIEKERVMTEAVFASVTPKRLWTSPFVVPVPGEATSSFGRRSIINGEPRGQHTGTDFQAATGTPVVAPNDGKVVLVADLYFAGRTIIIDHGVGVYSYLAHLSECEVSEGATVTRGQRIALSGSTGRVTGPHLHWTMRIGSARVDPLALVTLSAGEPRGRNR
jgi:murein DD-endopeptidase MepM/ murein hydrolase activator NlpD